MLVRMWKKLAPLHVAGRNEKGLGSCGKTICSSSKVKQNFHNPKNFTP